MIMTFVLIMVFGGATSQSGIATVTQEFSSFEACENARLYIAQSIKRGGSEAVIRSQGCFKR